MAKDVMAISCLRFVTKCCAMASGDARRRRCAKGSRCDGNIRGPKRIRRGANVQNIKRHFQNILQQYKLLPPKIFMRIILKPLIRPSDVAVPRIVDEPICMQKTPYDFKKGSMSIGLCIILFGFTSRHIKYLQWL